MNKIKDFLYDKNDVLIAILIMVLAIVVIGWRVKVLFDYPSKAMAGNQGNITSAENQPQGSSQSGNNGDGSSQGTNQGDNQGGNQGGNTGNSDEDALWVDGKTTKDITVKVKGSSATEAIQCLIDVELFKDYDEYMSVCESAGKNHEKVSAGTFTFKAGTTKGEIVNQVNWS